MKALIVPSFNFTACKINPRIQTTMYKLSSLITKLTCLSLWEIENMANVCWVRLGEYYVPLFSNPFVCKMGAYLTTSLTSDGQVATLNSETQITRGTGIMLNSNPYPLQIDWIRISISRSLFQLTIYNSFSFFIQNCASINFEI